MQDNIRLHITSSFDGESAGEIDLRLMKTLRVLEGRREVWLAETTATGRRVVAKRFLCGGKQGKESQREIHGLNELKERNIEGPSLLFVATDGQEGIWVVTDYIEDSVDLSDVLVLGAKSSTMKEAVKSYAQTLILHWRNGVYQTDVHNKNYLWDGEVLYTVDVGSIRFRMGAVTRNARITTLTKTCFKFTEEQWAVFLHAYDEMAESHGEKMLSAFMRTDTFRQRIERRKRKEMKRLWKKSQRTSSDFKVTRMKGIKLFSTRLVDSSLVDAVLQQPDSLLQQGTRLKSGNTCTVQLVEWGGIKYVVKRYNRKSLLYRIRHSFSTSRVIHSWATAIVLHRFRVRTPAVAIACEFRKFGLPDRGYLIMEYVDGETLGNYMKAPSLAADERDACIGATVDLFDRLYKYSIVHGDMKAKNLLVEGGKIWLIDIDGTKLFLNGRKFIKSFEKDRRRFLMNWNEVPELEADFDQALSKSRKKSDVL